MNSFTSLLSRLFGTSDPQTGQVRASVEKMVAGLSAGVPGLIGLLNILGVIGPDREEALTESILAALTGSPEWLTLMVLGMLWWRKRDQQDQVVDGIRPTKATAEEIRAASFTGVGDDG